MAFRLPPQDTPVRLADVVRIAVDRVVGTAHKHFVAVRFASVAQVLDMQAAQDTGTDIVDTDMDSRTADMRFC